jgi:predicted Ser/Thr protein kinase
MPESDERETLTAAGASLTPERFARLRRIFEEALERRASERHAFLESACAGDGRLLEEVQGMLAAAEKHGPLIETPPPSSAPEEGRFPAGTVLAGRYRILGLLGKGGMGEVYRAFDLILNQAVALKFLTGARLGEAALTRFRNEVRVARQVSHPNVCRVYDVGMTEGLHFLSMEYIDGEDLHSLLRRIGRLSQDKAVEFTRKICAGLAAAHERGILHRDLKPTNIMIDGRGQPRIADFGLAALADEVPLSDLRSGTPAYMSPEQKAGREVTTRSDLYSLGLVLHEMFTGHARAEGNRGTQSTPSDLVKDLDSSIERVILRCLEEDPKRRPSSALSVAMALPGGDPIAAALAAGETPSPEMVAASQEKEGFSTRTAVLCFAVSIACLATLGIVGRHLNLLSRAPLDYPPDVLAFQAQGMLRAFGYSGQPRSVVYGFDQPDPFFLNTLQSMTAARRDAILASHRPAITRFWFRESQNLFNADTFGSLVQQNGAVSYDAPANTEPGMIRMALDAKGRLIALEARPPEERSAPAQPAFDWMILFAAAGLDRGRFTAVPPAEAAPMAEDAAMAWNGTWADGRDEPVHIEAAAWEGRPVFFEVTSGVKPNEAGSGQALTVIVVLVVIVGVVAACILAWRNLRSGRGDTRGAGTAAGALFVSSMLLWVLGAEHVATPWELQLAMAATGQSAVLAGMVWLAHMAVEPYARRRWPDSLISWTRLQSGRFRDALVGSHFLAGMTAFLLVNVVSLPFLSVFDLPNFPPFLYGLNSGALPVRALLTAVMLSVISVESMLLLVVVLRMGLRNEWAADGLAGAVIGFATGPPTSLGSVHLAILWLFTFLLRGYVSLWLLRRFGLLAMWAAWFGGGLLILFSTPNSWYIGRAASVSVTAAAMAGWALWVITAGQPKAGSDRSW